VNAQPEGSKNKTLLSAIWEEGLLMRDIPSWEGSDAGYEGIILFYFYAPLV
jgi:hypothetical protein